MRERLWKRVQEHAGPAPKGVKRQATTWVKPGLKGHVKHLRGEDKLRHASLQDFWEIKRFGALLLRYGGSGCSQEVFFINVTLLKKEEHHRCEVLCFRGLTFEMSLDTKLVEDTLTHLQLRWVEAGAT